jgi:hypothetical protein
MNLKIWAVRFLCAVLVFSSLLWAGVCFADMPNPGPSKHNVEIQGAKVISEGGYLWFHVVSHDSRPLFVEVHAPPGVRAMENSTSVKFLHTDESADFFFQVSYLWTESQVLVEADQTTKIKFVFEIYTMYRTGKMTDENVEFNVSVVPLNQDIENWNLLYFAISTIITLIVAVIVLVARSSRM